MPTLNAAPYWAKAPLEQYSGKMGQPAGKNNGKNIMKEGVKDDGGRKMCLIEVYMVQRRSKRKKMIIEIEINTIMKLSQIKSFFLNLYEFLNLIQFLIQSNMELPG